MILWYDSLDFSEPVVIDVVHNRHESLISFPEIKPVGVSAVLPLVEVVGDGLAIEFHSVFERKWLFWMSTWATNISVCSVLDGSGCILIDSIGMVQEALWAHVWQVVLIDVVVLEIPLRLIVLVGMLEVESMGFKVRWQHSYRINIDDIETLWLALVCSSRPNDEVHADGLLLSHVTHDLVLLLVDVGVLAKTNHRLISIQDSMVSPSILPVALINIWDVGKQNGLSTYFLELRKFVF